MEAITDCEAAYISHNFISSILIESIPLYRDITYYRSSISFICESGEYVLTMLCIHYISLIQPVLLRKMNSRDKSCACIDFTSRIGVLMTLSSSIKWRGKSKFKSNLNHPTYRCKNYKIPYCRWTYLDFKRIQEMRNIITNLATLELALPKRKIFE